MSNPVPPPGGANSPEPAEGESGARPPGQPLSGESLLGEPVSGKPLSGESTLGEPPTGAPVPGEPVSSEPGRSGPGVPPPPGQQGFGPAPGGQQGFGPAPGQEGFGSAPAAPAKKSGRGRLIAVVAAVVVALVVLALRFGLSGAINKDKAQEAKVGNCVAAQGDVPKDDGKTTSAGAELVDCASTKAKFTVVGRVEGETDANSKSCDKYFTDEKADYFVYSSSAGKGFLLCLQTKA